MNEELQRLRVVIEADISALKNGVKEAEKVINEYEKTVDGTGKTVGKSLGDVDLSGLNKSLAEETIKLNELKEQAAVAKKEVNKLSKALDTAKKILSDYGIKPEQITSELQPEIQAYEQAKAKLEEINSTYDAQKIKVAELKSQIEEAKAALDAYSQASNKTGTQTILDLKDVRDLTSAIKELKGELGKVNGKINESKTASKGSIFGSGWAGLTKRLIVLRALRTVIAAITTAIKEGIQYLVVYDQKLGDICGYNKTLSQLATNFEKLKVTVSVTAMTLLQTLAPALNAVMVAATYMVERVNELFAWIGGKKTYTAANPEYWKDYADYVKESNSKLKETKTLISGFDELNTISPTSSLFETDNPLTIEKETNAIRGLLGTLGLAGLIALLPKLISLFKQKNEKLKEQTEKTNKETKSIKEWVSQLNIAKVALGALAAGLAAIGITNIPKIDLDTSVFKEKLEDVKKALAEVGNNVIKPAVEIAVSVVGIEAAIALFNSFGEQIKTVLTNVKNAISETFTTLTTEVGNAFTNVSNTLSTWFSNTLSTLSAFVASAIATISSFSTKGASKVKEFATNSIKSISSFVQQSLSKIGSWASSFLSKISSALSSALSKITAWASSAISTISGVLNRTSSGTSNTKTTTTKKNIQYDSALTENEKQQLQGTSATQNRYNATKTGGYDSAEEFWEKNKSGIEVTAGVAGAFSIAGLLGSLGSGAAATSAATATTAASQVDWSKLTEGVRDLTDRINALSSYDDQITGLQTVSEFLNSNTMEQAASTVQEATQNIGQAVEGIGPSVASLLEKLKELVPTGFANGGVVTRPTLALTGEYSGASSNPEIITPENKMKSVMDSSNSELASIYVQVGRQIIQAIENKDMSVSIGDMEIGRACARANTQQIRMTGKALI